MQGPRVWPTNFPLCLPPASLQRLSSEATGLCRRLQEGSVLTEPLQLLLPLLCGGIKSWILISSEPFLAESMQSATFPARQARTHYRHELRTLTYVTLDEANGGIVRNLSHEGVAVQAVAPLRQEQRVRLRFELRFPRLRIDTSGQVSWARPWAVWHPLCGVARTYPSSDR